MKTFVFFLILSPVFLVCQNEARHFLHEVESFKSAVSFTSTDVVIQKTFNSYLEKAFRKQVLGFSGDVPQGSTFGLELNEDKTNAVAQISYRFKDGEKQLFKNLIIGLGFTASIENNSFVLYSGKTGFGTDFSINLPITKIFKKSIFYDGSDRVRYINKRNLYVANLIDSELDFFRRLQRYKTSVEYRSQTESFDFIIDSTDLNGAWRQNSANLVTLNDNTDTLFNHYEKIFGTNTLTPSEINKAIDAYVENKIVEFETTNDIITGYSFWQTTIKPTYTSKSYVAFNDTISTTTLSEKFQDEQLTFFGGSIIVSKFKNTRRFYKNFNLDLSYVKESSFDQAENIKYKRNYVTNVTQYGDTAQTLYSTKTKEAFDLTKVQYKSNDITSLTISYSILGTKSKNFGFYGYAKTSYSVLYTNNKKIDFGIGPIFAIVADDRNSSKANFSFVFRWADVTNKELTRKDMFSVNFQVNIPVAFFTSK
jgi:hypothetical protein